MIPDDYPDHSGMDLNEGRRTTEAAINRLPTAEKATAKPQRSELDNDKNRALFKKLMGMCRRELGRQSDNRREMDIDEDNYDNIQWDTTDAEILTDRGQIPIVYNVLKPTLDVITGTEKRARSDFRILPRRKDGSKPAERKTQLMKYIDDVNMSQFATSSAFEDAIKVGVGWLECGLSEGDDGEPVYDRHESWRNMLWDSASTHRALEDGRYQIRTKWVDEDIAEAMFPQRAKLIQLAAYETDSLLVDGIYGDEPMDSIEMFEGGVFDRSDVEFEYNRRRVRLIEIWFRHPTKVKKLRGGDFSGQAYEEGHEAHEDEIRAGRAAIVEKVDMRVHVAIMCVKGLLYISQSPYRHNKFPFTPIWCNRRGKNGLPYGIIRVLRDIQVDINKRASKALAILSSNKVIMDEGAVDDLDELAEEVANPNAIIVKKANKSLELNADRELAPAHLELMSRNIAMIQSVSGVTDEYMGRQTNANSGVAIGKRQEQSTTALANVFDNLRYAKQVHGEKKLSLIEQFFTEEKSFRITNMRGTPEYITVNDGLPENDIIRTKADYVISEDDWRASVRQAQSEELLQLLQQLAPVAPQMAIIMLDLLVEGMDIPNRDEIVNRIRQQTGMRDPDAEEPTPQEIAKAQEAQEQAEMAKALQRAEIAEKQASAALKGAQAAKADGDAKNAARKILAEIANQNVAAQKAALETAIAMLSAPPAVPVADGVLHEAGFKSRTEHEDDEAFEEARQMQTQEFEQQALQEEAAMQEQQAAQQAAEGSAPTAQPMGVI
ncbi:MAG: hypothetical protein KGZ69_08780 [Methylomonas sp.]|nr:hypothetical protein [Methylomonas sp.]